MLEKIRYPLIVRVMSSHERFTPCTNGGSFAWRRKILLAQCEAGVTTRIERAVLAVAQHLRNARGFVSEVERPGEQNHPGSVGCIRDASLCFRRVYSEHDRRARADSAEVAAFY